MSIQRPCGTFDRNYAQDMAIVRTRWQWVLTIGGLLLLLCMPLFTDSRLLNLVNLIGIGVIVAHGLNIVTGYCGQIHMGISAFMAVGAYTAALLANQGVPFYITIPCGAIMAAVVGSVFALPSLRVKGFYLAMATLAAQFIIPALIANPLEGLTGGVNSLRVPAPEFFGISLRSNSQIFFLIIPLAILMTFFAKNLARTGFGRAFVAIRDNDLAAELMGINVFKYKLLAFFISSLFAGVAGALWAYWVRALNPEQFTLMDSIWYLGMVVVGGMGSTAGAVFGVIFIRVLEEFTKFAGAFLTPIFPQAEVFFQGAVNPVVFGLVIMLFLILEPRGLAHRWQLFKASYRLRPFPY